MRRIIPIKPAHPVATFLERGSSSPSFIFYPFQFLSTFSAGNPSGRFSLHRINPPAYSVPDDEQSTEQHDGGKIINDGGSLPVWRCGWMGPACGDRSKVYRQHRASADCRSTTEEPPDHANAVGGNTGNARPASFALLADSESPSSCASPGNWGGSESASPWP